MARFLKIRMIKLAAGPEFVLRSGHEYKVPWDQGLALVAAGAAIALDPIGDPVEKEIAVIEPAETAVKPKTTRRRRAAKRKAAG